MAIARSKQKVLLLAVGSTATNFQFSNVPDISYFIVVIYYLTKLRHTFIQPHGVLLLIT